MTVIGGRISGKLAQKTGARNIMTIGLLSAAAAGIVISIFGKNLLLLIIGVALLGLGFIFTHSTLLTRATEFAQKARGAAMSLVAFFFMGSGGIGTAVGGKLISRFGFEKMFIYYGFALIMTLLLSFLLIRDHVIEKDESKEEVGNL